MAHATNQLLDELERARRGCSCMRPQQVEIGLRIGKIVSGSVERGGQIRYDHMGGGTPEDS